MVTALNLQCDEWLKIKAFKNEWMNMATSFYMHVKLKYQSIVWSWILIKNLNEYYKRLYWCNYEVMYRHNCYKYVEQRFDS